MNENWRPIAGSPGYEISDAGRVRSVDRVITKRWRGRTIHVRLKGRILQPGTCGSGGKYLLVRLGQRRAAKVHVLVLQTFRGERPRGLVCRHLDGDPTNNALSNLAWGSAAENMEDRRPHGRNRSGANHHYGARLHCSRGHPYDEATRRENGRRVCATCRRDRKRRFDGVSPSRFKEAVALRVREGLRLVSEGMPIVHAAQLAQVDRHTLGKAWSSGARQ